MADPEVISEVLKLARYILVYFPEQTMCYFNANNFFPFLMSGLEDSIVNLHPFSQNSIALMILKYGSEVYPVLTQYVKLVEACLKVCFIKILLLITFYLLYFKLKIAGEACTDMPMCHCWCNVCV